MVRVKNQWGLVSVKSIIPLFFILFSIEASFVHAAIAVDSTGFKACPTDNNTSCSIPASGFTIGSDNTSGTNRMVIVGVLTERNIDPPIEIINVTINISGASSTEATLIKSNKDTDSSWISKLNLYAYNDSQLPATRGSYTIQTNVNNGSGAGAHDIEIVALSLTGVLQATPEASGSNGVTWPTSTVKITAAATTSSNNAWIVDLVGAGTDGTGWITHPYQTIHAEGSTDATGTSMAIGSTLMVTAGGTEMSWIFRGAATRIGHTWLVLAPAASRRIMIMGENGTGEMEGVMAGNLPPIFLDVGPAFVLPPPDYHP